MAFFNTSLFNALGNSVRRAAGTAYNQAHIKPPAKLTAKVLAQGSRTLTPSSYTPAQSVAHANVAPTLAAASKMPGAVSAGVRYAAAARQNPLAVKQGKAALASTALNRLLASNSPYLSGARTRGLQMANSRGLLNSSMAAGAAEAAAIGAAAPIAQADAANMQQMDIANLNAHNQFLSQNLSNQQQANMANANAANQIALANAAAANAANQFNAAEANRIALQNAAATNALNQFNSQARDAINQANAAAANQAAAFNAEQRNLVMRQGIASQIDANSRLAMSIASQNQALMNAIGQIQVDPNLTATAKSTAIQNLQNLNSNLNNAMASVTRQVSTLAPIQWV